MTSSNWRLYNSAKEYLGDGTFDMDNDTFNLILCDTSSNAATLSTTTYGGLTGELATASGYTQTGVALSTTWTNSSGTLTFDASDVSWLANGGDLGVYYAVIMDDTATNDELVCYSLLDTTPSLVTASDGNPFNIAFNAGGIFTLGGGTT